MGGIKSLLDVVGIRAGNLAQHAAIDRAPILEIASLQRPAPFPADEIVVAGAKIGFRRG